MALNLYDVQVCMFGSSFLCSELNFICKSNLQSMRARQPTQEWVAVVGIESLLEVTRQISRLCSLIVSNKIFVFMQPARHASHPGCIPLFFFS
jgi:hypothetical protein